MRFLIYIFFISLIVTGLILLLKPIFIFGEKKIEKKYHEFEDKLLKEKKKK